MDLKELLINPWYAAIVVFFTQILMLYFRTINIFYTTNKKVFASIWSNNANTVMFLISTTIGMNSVLKGQWFPLITYILGGSIGTYWGIKEELNKNKNVRY